MRFAHARNLHIALALGLAGVAACGGGNDEGGGGGGAAAAGGGGANAGGHANGGGGGGGEGVVCGIPTQGGPVLSTLPGAGLDVTFGELHDNDALNTTVAGSFNVLHMSEVDHANYAHWTTPDGTEMPKAMGLLPSELTRDRIESKSLWNLADKTDDPDSFSYFSKYLSTLHATGAKAFVSLNVVSTIDPAIQIPPNDPTALIKARIAASSTTLAGKEAVAALDKLTEKGVEIVAAKIGAENELNPGAWVWPIQCDPDCDGGVGYFIKRVQPIAEYIKMAEGGKYAKLPLIIHKGLWQRANLSDDEKAWFEGLGKVAKSDKPWFDGITGYEWLDYGVGTSGCDANDDIATLFACLSTQAEALASPAPAKNCDGEGIDAMVCTYGQTFGSMPIWLGQFNIDNASKGGVGVALHANTLLQGQFVADYLLAVAQYNSTHDDIVKSVNLQGFGDPTIGGDNGLGLENGISGYDPSSDDVTDDVEQLQGNSDIFVRRTPALALAVVHDIYDGHHHVRKLPSEITLDPKFQKPGDDQAFRAYAFVADDGDLAYAFVNRTGNAIDLGGLTLDGAPLVSPDATIQVRELYGPNLYSSYGKRMFDSVPFTPVTFHGDAETRSASSFQIQGLSVTVITLASTCGQ